MSDRASRVKWAYETLLEELGPQGWWPGAGPFETMVGAVLTQNTAWRNAERAIVRLREAGALSPDTMLGLPLERLEELVRPAGSWRRKAGTLAAIARTVDGTRHGLQGLLRQEAAALRETLLEVRGIGPETADAILLYAAGRPVFVVDAYTRRFVERHGIFDVRTRYEEIQKLFQDALGPDGTALAECHALIVALGKRFCRAKPLCKDCPLVSDLPDTE